MEGLFQIWLKTEKAKGSSQKAAISKLNEVCGTSYTESFPSKMKGRGYSLERIPIEVRRYMMSVVLPELVPDKSDEEYKKLIINLT